MKNLTNSYLLTEIYLNGEQQLLDNPVNYLRLSFLEHMSFGSSGSEVIMNMIDYQKEQIFIYLN